MLAAADCTPNPTIVCELGRIADSLGGQATPGWFDWLQFAVAVLSLLATLAVGAIAAYIAYRSHRLASETQQRAAVEAQRAQRETFHTRLQDTVFAVLDVAAVDSAERRAAASLALGKVSMLSMASGDAAISRLSDEVIRLNKAVLGWSPEERVKHSGNVAGVLLAQASLWVRDPTLFDSLPAVEYPE